MRGWGSNSSRYIANCLPLGVTASQSQFTASPLSKESIRILHEAICIMFRVRVEEQRYRVIVQRSCNGTAKLAI